MARVNVYLPAELAMVVEREMPGLNLSAVLQDALRVRLECSHHELSCSRCAAKVDRPAMVGAEVARFYAACLMELEPLVNRRGTAEGACILLKRVATKFALHNSDRPLPRPARAARRGNRRSFPPEQPVAYQAAS